MTDKQFVADATRRWGEVLDYANDPARDGKTGAIAVALWAAMNVDRLLRIAADNAAPRSVSKGVVE